MALFSSLFSVLGLASWIILPLNAIFLTLDGIVYSMVAYSYRIFEIIAQLNVNTIITWVGPVIDRVKSLILVLIMFKLGIALIQYMVNPDQIEDKNIGGAALVKNIFIVAVLLVTYNFVFTLFNELSLLIVGTPNGYEFTVLKDLAGVSNSGQDNGLIARFIFGSESADKDFGQFLAVNTLETFLRSKDGQSTELNRIYNEMESADIDSGTFDMMEIITIVDEIGRTVQYRWPLISTAVGIYLVYCLIKLCLELSVRAFKIVILQLIAPVAIVTILGDKGWKSDTWQKYVQLYISVYIEAFMRVATMYLVCALICIAYKNLDELLVVGDTDGITAGIVKLIIVFGGFQMISILPKFLSNLGFKGMDSNIKGSKFGHVLGGIVGAGIGMGTGLASGIAGGAGFVGTLGNAVSGAYNGGVSGAKGKNVAEFFKNEGAVAKANKERAAAISRQGGGFRYAGAKIEGAMKIPDMKNNQIEKYNDTNKLIDKVLNAQVDEIKGQTGSYGIKYGDNAESYGDQFAQHDATYTREKLTYENMLNSGTAGIQQLQAAKQNMDRAYNNARQAGINQWNTRVSSANGSEVLAARRELKISQRGRGKVEDPTNASRSALQSQQKANKNEIQKIQNSGAMQRANRQNTFNSK